MRINEVSKKTGCTKKAIHFYVSEGLLHPHKNENNYYDFSLEDINILNQILTFRKAGLSIQTIKEIYNYPAAANFFLHRSFNQIKQEIAEKMMQLDNLEMILDTIPPNGTPDDIGKIPKDHLKTNIDTFWIDQKHPSVDERMIAILLLAPFMDVPVDEYRHYLWNKIFNDLKYQFQDNVDVLKTLIYSLNGTQIRESSTFQFNLMKKLAEDETVDAYVDYLNERIHQICTDKVLQEKWMLLYEPVLIPVQNFFRRTSEKKRISQYNPLFDKCSLKLNETIKICYDTLSKETEANLMHSLNHKFKLNDELYSDLFILFTFQKSIYAQCSIQEIKQALHQ